MQLAAPTTVTESDAGRFANASSATQARGDEQPGPAVAVEVGGRVDRLIGRHGRHRRSVRAVDLSRPPAATSTSRGDLNGRHPGNPRTP
ncbi:MAG: hypothetical protein QOI78_7771 [Actinomycetota bacterium]|nr:hypothetical protein [Actinomycetota bacterium]